MPRIGYLRNTDTRRWGKLLSEAASLMSMAIQAFYYTTLTLTLYQRTADTRYDVSTHSQHSDKAETQPDEPNTARPEDSLQTFVRHYRSSNSWTSRPELFLALRQISLLLLKSPRIGSAQQNGGRFCALPRHKPSSPAVRGSSTSRRIWTSSKLCCARVPMVAQKLTVSLLDQVVNAFYSGNGAQVGRTELSRNGRR